MESTRTGQLGGLPWGKMSGEGHERILYPLVHHTADVCAVLEALLEAFGAAHLASLAGRPMADAELDALCALAGLHDLGKCASGFQSKRLEGDALSAALRTMGLADAPAGGRLFMGHTDIAWEALANGTWQGDAADAFWEAIDEEWLEAIDPSCIFLRASMSHHGRPVRTWPEAMGEHLEKLWSPFDGYDPTAALSDLVTRVRSWYPNARGPLRQDGPLAHAYAGLVSLADWIGSNTDDAFFPYDAHERAGFAPDDRIGFARRRAREVVRLMGLDAETSRLDLARRAPGFGEVFRGPGGPYAPTDLQTMMGRLDLGSTVAVEAETGSGKTEAAVWRYKTLLEAGLVDGLYFALPTRVAATQIEARLRDAIARAFPDEAVRPAVVLAVPGYLRVDGEEGSRASDEHVVLSRFDVLWPDGDAALAPRRWAGEGAKRFLAAPVAAGTVDQALLGAIMTGHAHLRGACLLRSLLVVDEVHASDAYMTSLLAGLLRRHESAGGHALLLSATLGSDARRRFLPHAPEEALAADAPYPCVVDQKGLTAVRAADRTKTVAHELASLMDDPGAIADLALRAASKDARVLIIRNTVSAVVAVQEALEAAGGRELLFRTSGVISPHHSRYVACDRRLLDRSVEEALGKTARRVGGLVVCASQTCEVSLDIDADLLLTDLAPADVLLQRVGRLHRHPDRPRPDGFDTARLVVLTPGDDLAPFLRSGRHGLGSVYPDVTGIEATRRWLSSQDGFAVPRDNRFMVEAATRGEELDALAAELGPAWQDHRKTVFGTVTAQRGAAGDVELDWTKTYGEAWVEAGEEVATRLGARDRVVRFEPAVPTPFGLTMSRMSVPDHLAKGAEVDTDLAEGVVIGEGCVRFGLGGVAFVYDRLGLRRE